MWRGNVRFVLIVWVSRSMHESWQCCINIKLHSEGTVPDLVHKTNSLHTAASQIALSRCGATVRQSNRLGHYATTSISIPANVFLPSIHIDTCIFWVNKLLKKHPNEEKFIVNVQSAVAL